MRKLIVKVKEIKGKCDIMKIGDYFIVDGSKLIIPEKNKHVCIYSLSSLLPLLPAKQRNIVEPEDWLPRTSLIECPDPNGRVIWEISYIEE
jgi:uncharacterized repeat protein (TIGR04076 family)